MGFRLPALVADRLRCCDGWVRGEMGRGKEQGESEKRESGNGKSDPQITSHDTK